MKRLLLLLGAMLLYMYPLVAQTHEFGVGLGTASYLGDLGRRDPGKNSYLSDIAGAVTKPAGQLIIATPSTHM